jgi:hypothetical protein
MSALPAKHLSLTSPHGLAALGAMAGLGLLLGIVLAAPWVSPLAAGLPGLGLLAWTALLAVSQSQALRLIPLQKHAFGVGFHAMLVSGVLALLGLAMIFPLFVPSRWRRAGGREDEDEDAGLPTPTGLLS